MAELKLPSLATCWHIMARHSHYGLVLMLGPLLVFLMIGGIIGWGQNYARPLIWGVALVALWWQMTLANGTLFWLHRLRGHPRQPILQTLWPRKGTWPVFWLMLMNGLLGMIPEIMINLEGEDMAPLSISLALITGIFCFWIYVRLLLVPVLCSWHQRSWSSWGQSWRLTAGPSQWRLAGQLLAGLLPCYLLAALIQHFVTRPHIANITDLFILPVMQMILMLVAMLWPLTIAAAFCYGREQSKGK